MESDLFFPITKSSFKDLIQMQCEETRGDSWYSRFFLIFRLGQVGLRPSRLLLSYAYS